MTTHHAGRIPRVLRAAAAMIRRPDGWCQGVTRDERGRYCAVGAIITANRDDVEGASRVWEWDAWPLRRWVAHALRLVSPPATGTPKTYFHPSVPFQVLYAKIVSEDSDPIPYWNDAKGQTAENVAVGLEYAALLYEQEHATATMTPGTAAYQHPALTGTRP